MGLAPLRPIGVLIENNSISSSGNFDIFHPGRVARWKCVLRLKAQTVRREDAAVVEDSG
jgi:hypothetical protein